TYAIVRLAPARKWPADSWRRKPSSSIAVRTRSCVSDPTSPGLLRKFDTVPTETPACRATSLMLTSLLGGRGRRTRSDAMSIRTYQENVGRSALKIPVDKRSALCLWYLNRFNRSSAEDAGRRGC